MMSSIEFSAENIMRYVIPSHLWEHLNLVRFKKRAAKTPQHGFRYGSIIMPYDIINNYFYYNDFSVIIATNYYLVTHY